MSTQPSQNTTEAEHLQDEGYFVIIPPVVLADEELPTGAKLVYGRVFGLTKKYGYCNASSDFIGRHIGFTTRTVQTYLGLLYKKGYLRYVEERLPTGTIERRIFVSLTPPPATKAPGKRGVRSKSQGGYDQNRRGVRLKSYRSNKSKEEREEGESFRKGFALKPKKEEEKKKSLSYSRMATGNQNTTTRSEQSKASKASPPFTPLTQEEIARKKARGFNASGFHSVGEIIGIPAPHRIELQKQFGDVPEDRSQPWERHGHWKKAPLFIQGTIGNWFSLEMHDQAINSTITRVHRIYQQWAALHQDLGYEELQDDFYNIMHEARARAKNARITSRTPTGQVNRTPFFLKCLEDLSGLRPTEAD